ncbi:hypothetical protein MK528_11330, partial [Streptococcus gordonii]|nr:hypothetical protein [Streptococcus gordonii]
MHIILLIISESSPKIQLNIKPFNLSIYIVKPMLLSNILQNHHFKFLALLYRTILNYYYHDP